MARRGGYMGGMPGNMNNLMKQAQRMQRQLEENKKKLEETDFTVTSGGGAVRLTVSGARVVKDLQIDPEAVDPDDVEMLQDMIVAAVNQGIADAQAMVEQKMSAVTGGMNIPGLF